MPVNIPNIFLAFQNHTKYEYYYILPQFHCFICECGIISAGGMNLRTKSRTDFDQKTYRDHQRY